MTIKKAIDQFIEWKGISSQESTVRGYANDLKIFCILMRNKEIEDVSLDDIMGMLTDMMEAGWTHASMMRKCMALRKLFEFMQMQGIEVIHKELIPIPQPERKLPRVATEEEYRKLLETIPSDNKHASHIRDKAIIRMLWDTGVRITELCNLNVSDLDLRGYKAIIRTLKTKRNRTHRPIFWTEGTNTCLRHWVERRKTIAPPGEDALFIACKGYKSGNRLDKKGVGEMLRVRSNRAGLPRNVNAHSFRHHMGHDIIKNGGTNSDIAAILGHASLLSTFAYTQLSNPETEERYRKLVKE